ncbi:MAG TPA: enolase C-terminal domain-like protein [Caldilineaceae bacterium]|nr:enolase C-terminal domain-like protein [Caldilineaceae bacterium]
MSNENRVSDIRILEVQTYKVPTRCRTPLKFGAVVVEELPIGYARVVVENRAGAVAEGWGAMFLMDLWAWPLSQAGHEAKNRLMRELLDAYAQTVKEYGRYAHPIEIFMETEAELRRLSRALCARYTPGEEMPFLGALISASPVDHAVHDAFGKANGIDSYRGYGPEHLSFDLARYLGPAYRGVYPSQFLRQDYLPQVPIFHLVGGLDLLRREEVTGAYPQDGIPNSLDDWIARDGVFCLKVKLQGRDLAWDLARTQEVSRVYHEVRATRRPSLPARPYLTADTNEQCESPEYMVEYLRTLREQAPQVYDEILYIEQPTERDLLAHRWDMRPLARLKPVLIDESLSSVEDFRLARELGWSGIALKSCKCLSADLLFVALAELDHIPYAVQDLTNPSLALLASVGLAARTHPILGVEANSRQFFPAANHLAAALHPDLYHVRDGFARTHSLRGPGLGMRVHEMPQLVQFVEQNHAQQPV